MQHKNSIQKRLIIGFILILIFVAPVIWILFDVVQEKEIQRNTQASIFLLSILLTFGLYKLFSIKAKKTEKQISSVAIIAIAIFGKNIIKSILPWDIYESIGLIIGLVFCNFIIFAFIKTLITYKTITNSTS